MLSQDVLVYFPFLFRSRRYIRAKVSKARLESNLFDCEHYARGLEILYDKMWERYKNGVKTDHIEAG